ncbi:hypothetical protein ABW19_dt0203314 [Dactylella cylindrospora]|nr:hypothetical protein ABW19_dt0203314 [Dactylella cylindrospora]
MVNLRIPRTATFAWSEGSSRPLIATGTAAGAVSADFSNDTHLELWDLDLDSGVSDASELSPKVSVSAEKRFHDIAWGTRGLIAGGLDDGVLGLWNADALFNGESGAVNVEQKHTAAIKTLQFNPFKDELLLTAGGKGEMYVWDLNNVGKATFLGTPPQGPNESTYPEYSSVDWNKKIAHILLSGGKNSLVKVWDVRQNKESLSLSHLGRKEISAVAWHPDNATKLLTALPDSSNPVIMLWDLRNANAPEKTLTGHDQGILSLDWCKQDPEILLSSGQDNRTICWNPNSGEILGEFPIGTNWMFRTRFNPKNPNITASASYDGKISIQSLQSKSQGSKTDTSSGALDGEDFFNQASFDPQGPSFSLKQAPKWYKRPVGATFGFGGKLASFGTPGFSSGQYKSTFKVTSVSVDPDIKASTEAFESALRDGNFSSLCEKRIEESSSDADKTEWTILRALFDSATKKKLIEFLGFTLETAQDDIAAEKAETPQVNGAKHERRLSSFFGESGTDDDAFLSELSSTKGARTNNPFSIYSGFESEADKSITKALILGDFSRAVDVCIQEDRLSDAFMLAVAGGQDSLQKVQRAYFAKKSSGPSYLRILASVVDKNLWDIVHNADLADWKEVLCTICTYAEDQEFAELCEALGERLEEEQKASSDIQKRQDAATCYLSGSKLEKVVGIWIEEYKENEAGNLETAADTSTSFNIHINSIQQLIEKVTVFREATKFVDAGLKATEDWKLASLYNIYCEYADVLANQGQLDSAAKYLNLVPGNYPAAEIARNRVNVASGKETKQRTNTATKAATTTSRVVTRSPYPIPATTTPTPKMFTPTAPTTGSVYNPQVPSQPSTSYTPQVKSQPSTNYTPQTQSKYTPSTVSSSASAQPVQPVQPTYASPYGSYNPQPSVGPYGAPPPRNFSPSGPPPVPAAQRTDLQAWNDTPDVISTARRKTPSVPSSGPITSPFPHAQPGIASPTASGPAIGPPPRGGTPGLPPPPKAGQTGAGIPRGMSPATVGGPYRPQTPSSQAQNLYGTRSPPPGQAALNQAPPHTTSQYAQPPAASGPSSNRYTPQLPAQTQSTPLLSGPGRAYSGQYATPPPPSQYAPSQTVPTGGPPPAAGAFLAGPPPAGSSRPTSTTGSRPTSQSGAPPPSKLKYQKGDRSHIPESSLPLYNLMNDEMERIKPLAPPDARAQMQGLEKRLGTFFDHLNNDDKFSPSTVQLLTQIFQHVKVGNFDEIPQLQSQLSSTEIEGYGSAISKLVYLSSLVKGSSQKAY